MTLVLLALVFLPSDQILRAEILAFVKIWTFDFGDWHRIAFEKVYVGLTRASTSCARRRLANG
jgi:hypothetical protein